MPRRSKNPSDLTKWRLNQGVETGLLVTKTGLSQPTINRIERGIAVGRVQVKQYLLFWGGDFDNLKMFPMQLQIIDAGAAVRIIFKQQKIE
jgi:hypothetical protein